MKIDVIIVFSLFMIALLCFNKRPAGMYKGILFGGLVYYGIVPLLIEVNKDTLEFSRRFYANMSLDAYVKAYIILAVFFLSFAASNKAFNRIGKTISVPNDTKLARNLKSCGYFCFVVGGISLIFFFHFLGGISEAFAIAELARSFNTSLTEFMPYYASLLFVPARLITVAPFLFWTLMYLDQSKKKYYKVLTIISFVMAWLFFLFNAGRAQLLMLAMCIIVPIMLNLRVKHTWIYVIVIGYMSLPLLDVLDALFIYMQSGKYEVAVQNNIEYLNQFSYPMNNVFHSFNIGDMFGYRMGKDFITSVLDLAPGLDFEASYVPTSLYHSGINWDVLGGTPNDIVTFSILQFHVLGVIIIPVMLGIIAGFVDRYLRHCADTRIRNVLGTVITVNSFLVVANADAVAVFRAFILWLIPVIFLFSCKRLHRTSEV